jgi:hypothetical protein
VVFILFPYEPNSALEILTMFRKKIYFEVNTCFEAGLEMGEADERAGNYRAEN